MSWRRAPLYVESHDLARWVLERASRWQGGRGHPLAPPATAAACELVGQVSLALTFPATRPAHLEAADHSIVRLRTLLRLARDLGLVSSGGLRYASGRLQAAGRMIGGWRKRVEKGGAHQRAINDVSGDGLPVA